MISGLLCLGHWNYQSAQDTFGHAKEEFIDSHHFVQRKWLPSQLWDGSPLPSAPGKPASAHLIPLQPRSGQEQKS